ncbi:MAG: 16S rRNA (adenine(1518)-N(6)/adenine(1519)-N(6))-dimethyltransferase RsmA [Bacteroidota bacterium]|nr:16S rRNA (adenine(1518)-N(6)/adenine(1519)-N(6))-dimethyltransferase RsmA [Bacteroidota bacterium]
MSHTPKHNKAFGQHFLVDQGVLESIVAAIQQEEQGVSVNHLIEIGSGDGALTQFFVDQPNFSALEIDSRWHRRLVERYPASGVKIHLADVLRTNLLEKFEPPMAVIGNFPYNISSQIVFKILDNREHVPWVVGMFQKEVAYRLAAKHGSKVYGVTSVLTQAYYEVDILFDIAPSSFDPPPKVESSVLVMRRYRTEVPNCTYGALRHVVKTAFGQRRKMLRNSLKFLDIAHCEELLTLRPEQLPLETFIELAELYSKQSSS